MTAKTGRQLFKVPSGTERPCLGAFVFSPDPDISGIYAHAGFDFVIIDFEHGANDVRSTIAHLRACAAFSITPIIRLGVANFHDAGRLLDAGAAGFMLPHYGHPAYGASDVISSMRYAPEGQRPTCTGVPAAGFGLLPFAQTAEKSNRDVVAMGLIEDASVVERIDAVLDQSNVDCLMPGPADLATSLGLHGQLRHPTVLAAIEKIKTSAQRRNIPIGLYINDPVEVQTQDPTSIGFYVYSIDYKALAKHLNEVALEARKIYRAATQ